MFSFPLFSYDFHMTLIAIQITFDLHLFLSDSVSFIPVKLHFTQSAVLEPDGGDAFQFSPPSFSELFSQTRQIANARPGSYYFNFSDLTDDFKWHAIPIARGLCKLALYVYAKTTRRRPIR